MRDVLGILGVLAVIFAAIAFDVWRKDERAGHEAAFGGLMALVVLLVFVAFGWASSWLYAWMF